jgi:hypothetical protein
MTKAQELILKLLAPWLVSLMSSSDALLIVQFWGMWPSGRAGQSLCLLMFTGGKILRYCVCLKRPRPRTQYILKPLCP